MAEKVDFALSQRRALGHGRGRISQQTLVIRASFITGDRHRTWLGRKLMSRTGKCGAGRLEGNAVCGRPPKICPVNGESARKSVFGAKVTLV
jgi:hypothetical protein